MSAAKKFDLFPEEKYIQEGLKGGWITIEHVGMKHLVIDPDHFQGRFLKETQSSRKHFDMNHVRRLAAIRDMNEGRPLHPIVVFFDGKSKYYVGDGFHRVEENRLRKGPDIYAYVVKLPDWRHQATLYAAMCNQQALLPRSREDMRKAVELLFSDPECWAHWTVAEIAAHCGVGKETVDKYRKEYAIAYGLDFPRERPAPGPSRPRRKPARVGGPESPLKIAPPGIEEEPSRHVPPPLATTKTFREWLLDRRILTEAQRRHGGNLFLTGFIDRSVSRAIVLCPSREAVAVHAAIGQALLFRQDFAPELQATVVLEKVDAHAYLYSVAARCGISILSPEELVAEHEGDDDDGA